jgi:hypothetical protein
MPAFKSAAFVVLCNVLKLKGGDGNRYLFKEYP